MKNQLIRAVFVAILFTLIACSPPKHPNTIKQANADAIAAQAPSDDFRNVEFDDNFVLIGVSGTKGPGGFELQLAWRSAKEQKLEYLVAVHVLDEAGKIVGQADYKQSKAADKVAKNALWRDTVVIPYEKLTGAVNIGIGLMGEGQEWLLADRGPRDWDERRLLFPLPKEMPTKPGRYVGFLEAANPKSIVGWAWNPDQLNKHVEVEIVADGNTLGKVTADKMRDDLKGKVGDGSYGFVFETPRSLNDGKPHEIRATIAGEGVELKKSPKTLQSK